MKKARKLGLQSLALVLMAFTLVAAVAFGATNAWFTNKADTGNQSIALGNGVKATLTGSFQGPTEDAAHALGENYQYMPGDTKTFSGVITGVENTSEFYVRMKVEVTGNAADRLVLTSVTATNGSNAGETVTIDGEWNYLAQPLSAAETYAYTATLSIVGDTNTNTHINSTITVKVSIEIVQSANVTNSAEFWADSMATKENAQPIVAVVQDSVTA